jgi:RecB family exonuclease
VLNPIRKSKKRVRRPAKPEFSPTKIRTYLICPLMYKFVYVTKIGRYYYSPNIGDSFGGSVHRALHEFHAAGGHQTQTSDQLVERLRETWVGTGYPSKVEETEHLELGRRILEDYYQNERSESITLLMERQIREDMGEFMLVGRIDRLDERSDGMLEVIDYKTGRGTVTEDEVANDLAMSIYQLLVRRRYPGKNVMVTIHCLRSGQSASAALSDAEIVELEEMIRSVVAGMIKITDETDILPERKPACDRCNFFDLCERRARIMGLEWEERRQ